MNKPLYNKNHEETDLFNELRKRVNTRLKSIGQSRDRTVRFKAFLLPLLYFLAYFVAIFNSENRSLYIGCYIFMGINIVLIYLNLIHEAAHNNIFKTKKYNKWFLKIFDLLGANSYIWERRHILSHHSFPNVDGWDTDIEQSGPILVYPHSQAKGLQKYQHRFFFLAYPLYLFNWMFVRDFRDFFDKNRIIQKTQAKIPLSEKIRMIAYKLFYFFYQIFVPILFFGVSWQLALTAWLLQMLVASCFALFVLLPLHAVEHNEFPEIDENGNLPYSWMRHQFEVTNDLTNHNQFIRYVLGNFNYHVAHHLFPNYSYEYYPEITEEIRLFAQEHNLHYKRYPLFQALYLHYRLLKSNATSIRAVMEESM
ncbi:fatty acid desaturase family protein [Chryseobacterium sp. SC28]|uniref:fatty acid desaturase family protein n=1 Tax=Chryseobacterium sp. SC28 TaxID=2268028 RepID=UPI000F650E41|nr:fatty acid desaturase [Chryseobacterium sp. SC28]RRQ45725.1 stearoyl-CoA 9-desaturase [Chryseobacterium sp. SC28]